MPPSQTSDDARYMRLAIEQSRKSPPKPTNFCVGAVLVSPSAREPILATGYTLEEPGNTHAEQSAFLKFARSCSVAGEEKVEEQLGQHMPDDAVLYTTMEPCTKRSVGNVPCVDRILRMKKSDGTTAIRRICVGVLEPEKFVGVNNGRKRLEDSGVDFISVPGFEEEILNIATAGHNKD